MANAKARNQVMLPWRMEVRADRATAVSELLAAAIRGFGSARVRVVGPSLSPIISGDIIHIQKTNVSEILHGEIAVFLQEGRIFAHWVVGRKKCAGRTFLVTAGDRLTYPDLLISGEELLGRVQWIERGESRTHPEERFKPGQRVFLFASRKLNDGCAFLSKWLCAARAECQI